MIRQSQTDILQSRITQLANTEPFLPTRRNPNINKPLPLITPNLMRVDENATVLHHKGVFDFAKLLCMLNNMAITVNSLLKDEQKQGGSNRWLNSVRMNIERSIIDFCKQIKDKKILESIKIEILNDSSTMQADAMLDAFLSMGVEDRDTTDDLITIFLQLPKHLQVDELKRMKGLLRLNSVKKVG